MFKQHIQQMEDRHLVMPDFENDLEWFNSKPLSFYDNLKGKIVVLDFWTYCCINCIHVLPDLKFLEEKYKDKPVVFIGVHSAKFDNEKDSENIRKAILRYEITHPVVNDAEMTLWTRLGVNSWPTFAIVGPNGNLIYSTSGEGKRDVLDLFIKEALKYYEKDLNLSSIPLQLEKKIDSTLSFPGKLTTDHEKRLFISDSNHNRIVITSLEGKILEVVGSGSPGLIDGSFENCRFNRLQGLAYHNEKLYVADTENHALREVNLKTKQVTTLAGNSVQGRDYRGGKKGQEQLLSTPWDLCFSPDFSKIYIAMAGTHQIWQYNLEAQNTENFSGSGAEQNLNSHHLLQAAWAQPSGISYGDNFLYIADSESSSIRSIDLKRNSTHTLVGGDPNNPQNLFRFGDKEGYEFNALLQHPLGVLWLEKEKKVLVADTYNHKIKALDPFTKQIATIAGYGSPGFKDGVGNEALFSEPSGFTLFKDKVFIADTNNHQIRILDLNSKKVSTLFLQ